MRVMQMNAKVITSELYYSEQIFISLGMQNLKIDFLLVINSLAKCVLFGLI